MEKLATYGTQDEEKQNKNNTICVGHHYTQTNTNNVNKTWALLQTTGGKDEPNSSMVPFIFEYSIVVLYSFKWQIDKNEKEVACMV